MSLQEGSARPWRGKTPAAVHVKAAHARTMVLWLTMGSLCIATAALLFGVFSRFGRSGGEPSLFVLSALCPAGLAGLIAGMLDKREAFKPRYSRYVTEKPRVSLKQIVDPSVVVIEARVSSSESDSPSVQPPLVLDDGSGLELRLPMVHVEGHPPFPLMREAMAGFPDYRVGDAVVFVGIVVPTPSSPTYRRAGDKDRPELTAGTDWLLFKASTREEVVRALQQREPSLGPAVFFIVVLTAAALVLSVVTFAGR